jgi:hypothetical protein
MDTNENYFIYDEEYNKSKNYKDWIINCVNYKENIFILGLKETAFILPK